MYMVYMVKDLKITDTFWDILQYIFGHKQILKFNSVLEKENLAPLELIFETLLWGNKSK